MTEAQNRVYHQIRKFIGEKGYSPSFYEVACLCGFSSLATVSKHVNALARQGYIAYDKHHGRTITLMPDKEVYGMQSCDKGHEKIFFVCRECPLCPFIVRNAREVTIDTRRA